MVTLADLGSVLTLVVVSGVLLVRRPRHPVSILLAVMAAAWLVSTARGEPGSGVLWILSVPPLAPLLIAFPDGPRGAGWRRVFLFSVVVIVVLAVVWSLPIPESATPAGGLIAFALAASLVPIAAAAAVSLVRLWRGSHGQRRTRVGVVLAAGAAVVMPWLTIAPINGLVFLVAGQPLLRGDLGGVAEAFAWPLSALLVPLAVGLSMLMEPAGRRVRAVEAVWPWLFGAGAALLIGGTVASMAGAAGVPTDSWWPVAGASLAVAATTATAMLALRRGSARLSTDDRTSSGLRDLAERLGAAPRAEEVPMLVAQTVGRALELRGVAVDVLLADSDQRLASWGEVDGRTLVRPLHHAGAEVGRLVLSPHQDGVAVDLRALDQIEPPVAAVVAATRLTRQLEAARDHALTIRDQERARLRADLHDELSPSLAGTRLTVTAARDRLGADIDPEAEHLLGAADAELSHAAVVVRGILEDLRPDSLARLGLAAALRERAAVFDRPGVFTVTVNLPDPMPALDPAVETAVLRIAGEAIGNAARHSHGSGCWLTLTVDGDRLALTVGDDGIGIPALPRPGLGLGSMEQRAAALGGQLERGTGVEGGALIRASFPLLAERTTATASAS